MPPTARAGANQTIAFADLPQSVSLDGTASTASAGSIIAWDWRLLDKPAGSAASLTGATTATPSFTMDVPGGYRFLLIVQQTDLTYSQDPLDPDVAFQAPMDMPTAITEATGTTEFAALSIPALGERHSDAVGSPNDLMGKWRTLFLTVDALAGIEPAGSQQATRWVTAEAGPADADGSASNPFNATSAATNSFDGPWNQAKASLIADSTPATLGYTILAYGGDYDENIAITADRSWIIGGIGKYVSFDSANTFNYTGASSPLAQTNLTIGSVVEGGVIQLPIVGLGNPNASNHWVLYCQGVSFVSIAVTGTFLAGPQAIFDACYNAGTTNVPNLVINGASLTTFGSASANVIVKSIYRVSQCYFENNITVTAAMTNGQFIDCSWGTTPVFTGPASTANFDGVTAARFAAASGTFAGGAGKADYLPITTSTLVVDNGSGSGLRAAVAGIASATRLTGYGGGDLRVDASEVGAALSIDGNLQVVIAAAAGPVNVTAGTSSDVTITGGSSHGVVLAGGAGSTYDAKANVIAERTAAAGVTIDGVLCKDGVVTAAATSGGFLQTNGANHLDANATAIQLLNGATAQVVINVAGASQFRNGVSTDEISEFTVTNGVLVDQVLLQDTTVRATRVYTSGGNDLSLETAGIAMLFDESAQTVTVSDPLFTPNVHNVFLQLAVTPNGNYNGPGVVAVGYDGVIVGDGGFVAAVAATSVVGDITVTLRDGNGNAMSNPVSIDGVTETDLFADITASFSNGFFIRVTSDNPDAIQGVGLQAYWKYQITGPT